MIKNYFRKYSGLIFFYLTIVGMVLLVNFRVDYFDEKEAAPTYALSE